MLSTDDSALGVVASAFKDSPKVMDMIANHCGRDIARFIMV